LTATRTAERSWPAEASSVPAARRFVRDHLREAGLQDLEDDAALLVSELVGNVVLHVGGTVQVSVRTDGGDLVLEVSDDNPVAPQLRAFSSTASTGRGMRLVHSLSAEHGVHVRDGGKTIWARLTSTSAHRADGDLTDAFADVDWLAELADTGDLDGSVTAVLPRACTSARLAA